MIRCEVYSRVSGYYRPVNQWNKGKQAEHEERLKYKTPEGLNGISSNNCIGGNESILASS